MLTGFTSRLASLNSIAISRWLISDGMGFTHRAKWWAGGQRPDSHIGADLYRYESAGGGVSLLMPGAIVPVLWPGRVVGIAADFIATSVFIHHPELGLLSAFGHILPADGVRIGGQIGAADVVGSVAPNPDRACPAHLHISVAEVGESIASVAGWQELEAASGVKFLDPEAYLY